MKRILFLLFVLSFFACKKTEQTAPPTTVVTLAPVDPLASFQGYKVAANARQLGTDYWENSILPSDLIVAVFQKNYENIHPSGAYAVWTEAICNGDFNNDGYMDVFNGGTAFGGQIKATLTFLIWNPITKNFEEKNLLSNG
jgi:hypothetical protein